MPGFVPLRERGRDLRRLLLRPVSRLLGVGDPANVVRFADCCLSWEAVAQTDQYPGPSMGRWDNVCGRRPTEPSIGPTPPHELISDYFVPPSREREDLKALRDSLPGDTTISAARGQALPRLIPRERS